MPIMIRCGILKVRAQTNKQRRKVDKQAKVEVIEQEHDLKKFYKSLLVGTADSRYDSLFRIFNSGNTEL